MKDQNISAQKFHEIHIPLCTLRFSQEQPFTKHVVNTYFYEKSSAFFYDSSIFLPDGQFFGDFYWASTTILFLRKYFLPIGSYMFKVGNKNTSVFEHFTSCSSVSIVNFQQVNVYWVKVHCFCVMGLLMIWTRSIPLLVEILQLGKLYIHKIWRISSLG